MGVEEEFHLVDLKTRRLTARAPELLGELSDSYVAELQRCVVEMNSGVVDTLDGLRADLEGHRKVLVEAASKLGMTQSSLSHAIRRLEGRLGLRLLSRTTRSVAPTDAGERLLRTLRPAFEHIDAEIESLTALRKKPAGSRKLML